MSQQGCQSFSINILPFHGIREENTKWSKKFKTYFTSTQQHTALKGLESYPHVGHVWPFSSSHQD